MRTVKFHGQKIVTIEEVPDPVPGPGEVLIRSAVSAICGSEMHCYASDGMASGNPGHEGAGTVAALGEGVTDLKVGSRVGVSAIVGCGQCAFCARKQYTWCPLRRYYGSMHAEYFVTAAAACHPLPDDLSWSTGVLLTGDGFGVPYHTSTKIRDDQVRDVAVFGAGPIGLGNVIMEKYLGRRVIVVDFSSERLKIASRLGAEITLNPADADAVAAIKAATGGLGADVCIEAAGKPESAHNCFAAVRTGGQVIFNGEQGDVAFSVSEEFIRRDITATGSWFYHFGEYEPMLALYRRGLPVDSLVSDVLPFGDAAEAFRKFAEGKTAKVLLCHEEGK